MKQLNLFSLPVKEQPISKEKVTEIDCSEISPKEKWSDHYQLNQVVVVLNPNKDCCNSEDYYYLLDFAGKRGRIFEIHHTTNTLSYSVEFKSGKCGMFYPHDLEAAEV
jgi:hypothetical protein